MPSNGDVLMMLLLLGASAAAEGKRQGSEECSHSGHHDGAEAQRGAQDNEATTRLGMRCDPHQESAGRAGFTASL